MLTPTRKTFLAAALAAAFAASAGTAAADSISYVKDGNVFLTTPDGTLTHQVTTSGGYSSASQADDGKIVALAGGRFHVMNQYGDVLSDFAPVGSGTAGTITLDGPFDPAISPDGSRIAYGFYVQYKSGDPNCGMPGGCWEGRLYAGTGYTRSTGATEWGEAGFKPTYSWTDPSWIDNSRTLMSGPASAYLDQVATGDAGSGGEGKGWFSDHSPGVENLFDGEQNRQGTAAAFVANSNGGRLRIYRTSGAAEGTTPPLCLDAPSRGSAYTSPSWSPDGERLAFADASGLYIATFPGLNGACTPEGQVQVTLRDELAGAKSPDWGPADLPAPRPAKAQDPVPAPAPRSAPGASRTTTPALRLMVAKRTLREALASGLAVDVRCTAATPVKVVARTGRKTVGSGSATCRRGHAKVTVRFTKGARKALRRKRSLTLTLTATAGTTTGSSTVKLSR
jgi:hypothetical protein